MLRFLKYKYHKSDTCERKTAIEEQVSGGGSALGGGSARGGGLLRGRGVWRPSPKADGYCCGRYASYWMHSCLSMIFFCFRMIKPLIPICIIANVVRLCKSQKTKLAFYYICTNFILRHFWS